MLAQTSASRCAVAVTSSHSLARVEMLSIAVTPEARAFEQHRLLLGHALVIEVAVQIDEHQAASSAGSSMRGNSGLGVAIAKSLSASGEYQCVPIPAMLRASSGTPI